MADALSKADFRRFRREAAAAQWPLAVGPARVPGQLLAWLANPISDDELGSRLLDEMAGWGAVLGR
jgi:hypothetical protein